MGSGASSGAKQLHDYEGALMADTKPRGVVQTEDPSWNTDQGHTAIYRHAQFPDHLVQTIDAKVSRMPSRRPTSRFSETNLARKPSAATFIVGQDHGNETIAGTFQAAAKSFGSNNAVGWRPSEADGALAKAYSWLTYAQMAERVRNICAGLHLVGCKQGERVGIYAANCVDWTVVALACYTAGVTVVPLYDTLGAEAVEFIIKDAEVTAIVCGEDKLDKVVPILASGKDELKTVRTVVVLSRDPLVPAGQSAEGAASTLQGQQVKVCNLKQVHDDGAAEIKGVGDSDDGKRAEIFPEVKGEDTAIIMYTSGTTGVPKGVVLTHTNVMASVAGATAVFEFDQNDSHVSYLPLAHIFETVVQVGLLVEGGSMGFYSGNIKTLMDDIGTLKPTLFVGVPRIFQRIEQVLRQKIGKMGGLKKMIVNKALREQTARVQQDRPRIGKWDKKVFSKMSMALGGRVRLMLSGSAPLSATLAEFMKVCFNVKLVQGYGMTETAAVISVSEEDDANLGHVGPPMPHCEVRLEDIPEMNYLTTDKPCPRGEILVRGANMFKEYLNRPDATAEVYSEGRWLHTGDVGRINPNGTVR